MKKILFGLAAMSTLAFSAINLTTPTNETNTWMTGETGAIAVTGTITSAIPQVQYVVYASTDGNYDANGETLELADFVISQKAVENVFSAENPKVYVKRVNDTQDSVENLLDTDVVKFKVELESTRTAYSSEYFGANGSITFTATALIPDEVLSRIAARAGEITGKGNFRVEADKGMIIVAGGYTYYYLNENGIKFNSTQNGVLEIVAGPSPYSSLRKLANNDEISAIETQFSGGEAISPNVRILVTVNA